MNLENPEHLDTPAMRQYRTFKEQVGDYLLLFRMGDFYEMFYEDAKTASRVLGLALTSRSKGPSAVPLAGIPYHALDSYLARLVKAGLRVAICEQVEDPKQAKGLVRREVTRLVTPGTLTDQTLLDSREGNYLAAVFGGTEGPAAPASTNPPTSSSRQRTADETVGLAWVELSSGAFWAMTTAPPHVLDELVRIGPAEVIFPEGSPADGRPSAQRLAQCTQAAATARPPWAFDAHAATTALKDHFGAATLEGFGFRRGTLRFQRPGRSSTTSARRRRPPWRTSARCAGSTAATTWPSTATRSAAWRSTARSAATGGKARCWPASTARPRAWAPAAGALADFPADRLQRHRRPAGRRRGAERPTASAWSAMRDAAGRGGPDRPHRRRHRDGAASARGNWWPWARRCGCCPSWSNFWPAARPT